MQAIHPNSVLSAFAEVDGDAFERFFKEFGADVYGMTFTPLGGRHDGGADGFAHDGLFEANRRLLSFAPNADEVRSAYGAIMPSLVGVRLGNRSHPAVLRGMLDKVAAISSEDPARLKAEMERLANRLKANEAKLIERQSMQ